MSRIVTGIIGFLKVLSLDLALAADDGVLPQGKKSTNELERFKVAEPQVDKATKIDCNSYLADPASGQLHFTADGKRLYFLSHVAGADKPEDPTYLFEVDLENNKIKRVASLKVGDNATIVGHGPGSDALSILDFYGMPKGCGEGSAIGITLTWRPEQKIVKSFPSGRYKVVRSPEGLYVADLDAGLIKILDPSNYQKRTLLSYSNKFLPLYASAIPLRLYAFDPEHAELARFDDQKKEPSAVLKLGPDMRLLEDAGEFGILIQADKGHVLQVKKIKSWSGDAFRGMEIKLPKSFVADRLGVSVDFKTSTVLVYGAQRGQQRELRQVLIFNGAKGKIDRVMKAAEGQYFSQATFYPNTKKIVVLSRSLKGDAIHSLRIGELGQSEWREITAPADIISETASVPTAASGKSLKSNKKQKAK